MDTPSLVNSEERKPFSFKDKQQFEIYNYLKRLVGQGAAEFYKDACRIMDTSPPFDSMTHLVGHAMREINGSMLGVLEGISESIPKGSDNKQKLQAGLIIKALEIQENDPLAVAYMDISAASFDGLAHRNGLNPTRKLDEKFNATWEKTNIVWHGLLQRFETKYLNVFKVLDGLLEKETPSPEDITTLTKKIPSNFITYEHFFGKLKSVKWLDQIVSNGFFKIPPSVEYSVENDGIRHPTWPALTYLAKVAGEAPLAVLKIIKEINLNENGNVKAGILNVILNLPNAQKKELLSKIIEIVSSKEQFFSHLKAIDLVNKLCEENDYDSAFEISKYLLDIVEPDSTAPPNLSFKRPQTHINHWAYTKFVAEDFKNVWENKPIEVFDFLGALIKKYISIKYKEGSGKEGYHDYSYISRPAIEVTQYIHRGEVKDALIDSIINVAKQAVNLDKNNLSLIIEKLENLQWPIFKRIVLYILSQYPAILPEKTNQYLKDFETMHNPNYQHEYALLADATVLDIKVLESVYKFVEDADEAKKHTEKYETEAERKENYIRMWKRDTLAIFRKNLDAPNTQKLKDLEEIVSPAEDPKKPNQRSTVFVGPTSEFKSEDMVNMTSSELIDLLKNWKPKADSRGFSASREGLGRELGLLIKQNPLEYSKLANDFIELDPTYIRNYLQAFSEVVQHKVILDWNALISLSTWVAHQDRGNIVREKDNDNFENDPDWGWTRKAIASLLSNGMNSNSIPYEHNEKVLEIIEILSNDPDPTREDEINKDGELRDDVYGLTINSVRGEAMTTVVEYGLWALRHFEKLPITERPKETIFNLFPKLRSILDEHLVSDDSIAIKAVYGRYLPWLNLLDKKWLEENIVKIFPTGEFNSPLYDAVWSSYLGYVPLYDDIFDLLKPQYVVAVENIGQGKKNESKIDIDERLTEHIMGLYWRGKINFKDELFVAFWENADDETRAHAISFLGRSMQTLLEPLEDEVAVRLVKLWDNRIKIFSENTGNDEYKKEAGAFGWWFASFKFEENYIIDNFKKTLEHVTEIEADYSVIDRLVLVVKTRPLDAIKVLTKMIEKNKKQWMLLGNESDIKGMINTILRSSDTDAQKLAKNLVNRLVSWGHRAYGDLL